MKFRFNKIVGSNYSVSENGQVRNDKTGRILKAANDAYGYPMVTLPGRKNARIHQLVALAFLGPRTGKEINHIDGNKANNHFSNLQYCSQKENYLHAIKTGLRTKNTNRKVDDRTVLEIRKSILSLKHAAKKFGVSISTISDIRTRKTWRNL
jgi:HNH endonuclease/NUMOD4 motif